MSSTELGSELNIPIIESFDPASLETVPGKASFSAQDLKYQLKLIEELDRRRKFGGYNNLFVPGTPFGIERCPKHAAFFRAGATYRERGFFAGNRCGKTRAGAFEMALHLTGEYPSWWEGYRFRKRYIKCWAVAESAQKSRDTTQSELLGPPGKLGTGLIPGNRIVRVWAKHGTPNAIDTVEVANVHGETSLLTFKDYKQEVKAFYGEAQDCIWMDEEPSELIYNEALIRLMTTNGIMYTTCTPLHGLTPFLVNFDRDADHVDGSVPILPPEDDDGDRPQRTTRVAVINAGWDDAPWLDQATKEEMLERTPDNLKDARCNGRPAVGEGNVYPYSVESLLIEPFDIPDSWPRLYGMDVGYHNTAVIFGAKDPNTGIWYLYDEYLGQKREPFVNAALIKEKEKGWIPGVVDPAALIGNQIDGTALFMMYRDLGLNIILAKNEVNAGLDIVRGLMGSGKLKVFRTLHGWRREYVKYRWNPKIPHKVVKEEDHFMDAMRYLLNMPQVARSRFEEGSFLNGDDGSSGRRY